MKLTPQLPQEIKIADQKGRITLGSRYAGKRFAVHEEADGTAILTPVLIVPEKDNPLTSRRLAECFASLETLTDNWDGRGSPAPSAKLIAAAQETLALLQAGALARGLAWTDPHIGSNERGHILLEWWKANRALTVFVRSEDQLDYLKSWGTNVINEMEDGEISRLADFAALSRWLYRDELETI